MPHPLYVFFQVETWVSWFFGLLFFLSAWLRRPSHFKSIGRSKLAWMGITTLGLIPFVGIIPALVYFFRVYLYLPAKEHQFLNSLRDGWDSVPTAPRKTGQTTGGYQGPSRTVSSSTTWQMPAANCTRCSGGGKITCNSCGGSRQKLINGDMVPCFSCSASGQVACTSCGGSGKQHGA
jgi:hypothetical protein